MRVREVGREGGRKNRRGRGEGKRNPIIIAIINLSLEVTAHSKFHSDHSFHTHINDT